MTDDSHLLDPREAAKAAHLHYVSDTKPGIRRERTEDGWDFYMPDGTRITDEKNIARIKKLAIPPAYTDVWICRDPNGHLQAVGRDARGRKQYRYHPRWREIRDEAKYGKMLIFGRKLPDIRKRVEHDLSKPGLPREKVLAALVRLLERTLARIGNEEYARTNNSFGLTTLRERHATVHGATVELDFRAKHGIQRHIELKRKLANIVKKLQDIPGQELFHYIDEHGHSHTVGSDDVNATSTRSPAKKSPQRISAPGQPPTSPRWRCRNSRLSTAPPRPRRTCCVRWRLSPACWAIRPASAASVTFTRRSSTATSMAACSKASKRARMRCLITRKAG